MLARGADDSYHACLLVQNTLAWLRAHSDGLRMRAAQSRWA